MKTTIDSAGRVVIPRAVRNAAGLEPGLSIEVRVHDGVVTIEPAPSAVRIVRRGKLQVAVVEGSIGPLPESVVRSVREDVRNRR